MATFRAFRVLPQANIDWGWNEGHGAPAHNYADESCGLFGVGEMRPSPVLRSGQAANSESVVCDDRGGSPSSLASAYWLRSGPHSPSVSFLHMAVSTRRLLLTSVLKWSETTSDSFFYSVSHAEIPYIPRTPCLFDSWQGLHESRVSKQESGGMQGINFAEVGNYDTELVNRDWGRLNFHRRKAGNANKNIESETYF
ncbi:hypothetical protein TcasGA2_TC008746 [Tribolium castaneum]|uniref:Uncharacterized protein n=1 Tax=Tribolium castaneum TaxID=7070 RepID=D6WS65_TRICA|nr:hypothetical protein TcasGA2_TC008746 [Tribolium castaneum]